jgi:cell division transport system permease protein
MPLPYTIREGLAGFARTRFAAFTSTSALVLALALIGLVVLLGWQGRRVAEAVQARIGEVQVYLAPADTAAVGLLRRRFEALPGVEDVSFVSREEAARIFREEFGDEAELFDESLFLPASFRVRFHSPYTAPDSLASLKEDVERWPAVDEVVYEQTLLENVTRNVRLYSAVGLGIGSIVVLAALLLVGNTVRLSIYARRLLIRTMKLVGATDGFVRRPFLVEGAVQGLLAGAIAALLLAVLYASLGRTVEGLDRAGWPGGSPVPMLLGVVVLGGVLGLLASWVAVRTFLKRVRLS